MKHYLERIEIKGKVLDREERRVQRIGHSYFLSLPINLIRSIWKVLRLPLNKRILTYMLIEDEDTGEKMLIVRFEGNKKIDERSYPY